MCRYVCVGWLSDVYTSNALLMSAVSVMTPGVQWTQKNFLHTEAHWWTIQGRGIQRTHVLHFGCRHTLFTHLCKLFGVWQQHMFHIHGFLAVQYGTHVFAPVRPRLQANMHANVGEDLYYHLHQEPISTTKRRQGASNSCEHPNSDVLNRNFDLPAIDHIQQLHYSYTCRSCTLNVTYVASVAAVT